MGWSDWLDERDVAKTSALLGKEGVLESGEQVEYVIRASTRSPWADSLAGAGGIVGGLIIGALEKSSDGAADAKGDRAIVVTDRRILNCDVTGLFNGGLEVVQTLPRSTRFGVPDGGLSWKCEAFDPPLYLHRAEFEDVRRADAAIAGGHAAPAPAGSGGAAIDAAPAPRKHVPIPPAPKRG